ncbi:type IV pilus assembly protein PilY1 [Variovorax paradoxus]|uniref:pilus assembly protein n=1 Tax=Variovorax paradoxus TaxID=34073 RepID=UPI00278609D6|nr:PilC/PilY family type IV pilus protein [Variovorax paradoxus]MDP9965966.1 type IV pilus assembly protein PilY1 [Variovorax paradoxus]
MNNHQHKSPRRTFASHMARTWEFAFHPRLWSPRQRSVAWFALPLAALAISFVVNSQTTAPAFKAISLSSDPLYATTSGDKPTLALALSVEFPTVGAQYTPGGADDNTYSNTNEYLGYYDAEACYTYNNAPTETPATGLTAADYKRFDRVGRATNRTCSDAYPTAFSGNFLNWAGNSAIDMLRLALSGGDRYIDTTDLTILQRAVIPNGDPICMWNSTNFPAKRLLREGGSSGKAFWGAVPAAMATAAGSNDIWVGNTLNRMYFGTARGGGCGNTGSYGLSGEPAVPAIGTVTTSNSSLPADAVACSAAGATCSFEGIKEVWYGLGTRWKVAPASISTACTNGVFGNPGSGTKACYTRPYSGSWSPPASSAGGINTDGFFYARVQVCQKDSAGNLLDTRDYPFCTRYPSGNFKPGGVVQKYSDQLRLAAFGYLLEQTASYDGGRYGGVLRAPMKYVGTKTFDIYGQENTPASGNANAEWDPTTGVFKANPEAHAMGISGVVNYLNKFGRTGTPGKYKKYDPVSELYYESLRYMQGLSPSPDAISNITDTLRDGFPVYTDWSNLDPFGGGRTNTSSYACLKNNIVVIGDVNTHDGSRFPSSDAANNIPNLSYWTGVVQDFEKGVVRGYPDGAGTTRQTGNPNTANTNPKGDAIIGYSYWAHTHDIRGTGWTSTPAKQRPGLRVKTFIFDVNEYGDQNNATTRRTRNQFFTAAKYGGFESDSSNLGSKPFNTYGNPFRKEDGTADNNVWQDPENPGEAGTYYLQSSARGVLSAFDSIFSRASTTARSIAGSAVASQKLTANNKIYQGSFDTSNWSGDLQAFGISADANNNVSISSVATWSATERLAALTAPATSRNIVVGNAGATSTATATAFTWAAISTELQGHLNKPSPSAAADAQGENRLNYLRGSSANEGTAFRRRNNKLLGDIINSGVVYSGAPPATITSASYAAFRADNVNRTPAVFVGANDGMLHAFNAGTGDELFAYIPSWLGPKLSALTSPTYVSDHQSYVDASPAVAEAQVGSAGTKADWKTVLVSGTGAGGRGVFALDVTNPAAFDASKVMWEFTNADDADLGFVVGKPQILKMRTSAAGATATYKWFALVAGGVNNYVRDSAGLFSSTGRPALFLLDLAKPAGTAWTLGSNYYKISLPIDATLAQTVAPGLINFSAVPGSAREVTQVFAGDLHGNMWKLDFRPYGTADWNIGKLSAFNKGTAANPVPYPLFIAKYGTSNTVQPISMAPGLVAGQRGNSTYVAFGTGKYLEADDRASTAQNSFYVVHDNGSTTPDSTPAGASVITGRGRLQAGTLDTTARTVAVAPFVWGRAMSDVDATQRSGWYFDYATSGERQVSNALLDGETIIFGSLIPGSTSSASACGVSGGSGNEYRLDVDTGDGDFRVSTVGILGQPLVIELANSVETISNSTGRRTRTITSQVVKQGSGGIDTATGSGDKTTKTIVAGRLSWRQINNYQDLKNAP